MGRCAAILERQSWDDGRFVRWRDANARSDCPAAAPCGNLPGSDRQQLSRKLDVSRRRAGTVVRSELGDPTGDKHVVAIDRERYQRAGWRANTASHAISRV